MTCAAEQSDLFTFVEPAVSRHATIQQRFDAFNAANPWVLNLYLDLLRRARARGFKRIGIKFITELIRWEHAGATIDTHSEFKISNSYTSRYARFIIANYPEFDGFITLRELRSE